MCCDADHIASTRSPGAIARTHARNSDALVPSHTSLLCNVCFQLAVVGMRSAGMHSGGAVVVGLRMPTPTARVSRRIGGCRRQGKHSNQQERKRQAHIEFHIWSPQTVLQMFVFSEYTYAMRRATGWIRKKPHLWQMHHLWFMDPWTGGGARSRSGCVESRAGYIVWIR